MKWLNVGRKLTEILVVFLSVVVMDYKICGKEIRFKIATKRSGLNIWQLSLQGGWGAGTGCCPCRFDPWPGDFHMLQAQPKENKTKPRCYTKGNFLKILESEQNHIDSGGNILESEQKYIDSGGSSW